MLKELLNSLLHNEHILDFFFSKMPSLDCPLLIFSLLLPTTNKVSTKGVLKFYVEEMLSGVNWPWPVRCLFSKAVGIRDSNEAKVLAILEVLRIFSRSSCGRLFVESDSFNAVSSITHDKSKPWKLWFYFNEIKILVSQIHMKFCHAFRSANVLVDSLASRGR